MHLVRRRRCAIPLGRKGRRIWPKFGGAWKPPVSRAARVGNGRLLMDFGLDVANATPEGTSILDGLVAYARSPSFAPISELDIAAISSNGE